MVAIGVLIYLYWDQIKELVEAVSGLLKARPLVGSLVICGTLIISNVLLVPGSVQWIT